MPKSIPAFDLEHSADGMKCRAVIVQQPRESSPRIIRMVPFTPSVRHLRSAPASGINHAQSQQEPPDAANPPRPPPPGWAIAGAANVTPRVITTPNTTDRFMCSPSSHGRRFRTRHPFQCGTISDSTGLLPASRDAGKRKSPIKGVVRKRGSNPRR